MLRQKSHLFGGQYSAHGPPDIVGHQGGPMGNHPWKQHPGGGEPTPGNPTGDRNFPGSGGNFWHNIRRMWMQMQFMNFLSNLSNSHEDSGSQGPNYSQMPSSAPTGYPGNYVYDPYTGQLLSPGGSPAQGPGTPPTPPSPPSAPASPEGSIGGSQPGPNDFFPPGTQAVPTSPTAPTPPSITPPSGSGMGAGDIVQGMPTDYVTQEGPNGWTPSPTAGKQGGAMSIGDVYHAYRSAGFNDQQARMMTEISFPESGLNPNSHYVTPREDSRGLSQINVLAHPQYANQNLYDPNVNAKAAWEVSGHGTNFSPWTGYKSGEYAQHASDVNQALASIAPDLTPSSTGSSSTSSGSSTSSDSSSTP